MILARSWNQLVSRIRAARPLAGLGVRVIDTASGALVSADPSTGFEHPWKLSVRWQEEAWRVFVRPGFVNGRDVTISMTEGEVPLTKNERPYLTPAWRNPLASAGMMATLSGELVTLPGEGYPPFFKQLGVRDPARDSREVVPFDPTASERTREIRTCDIVLVTPRIATRTELELSDALTAGQMVTSLRAFVNDYARNAPAKYRLISVPKWKPAPEPTPLDRLLGQDVEPQTDEIKIATLWMVSPPKPPDGQDAIPDGTWVAYPQYDVFWNLAHAPRNPPPANPADPIRVNFGGIGLGYADLLGNAMLAPVNDAFAAAARFLDKTTFKGEFWTV